VESRKVWISPIENLEDRLSSLGKACPCPADSNHAVSSSSAKEKDRPVAFAHAAWNLVCIREAVDPAGFRKSHVRAGHAERFFVVDLADYVSVRVHSQPIDDAVAGSLRMTTRTAVRLTLFRFADAGIARRASAAAAGRSDRVNDEPAPRAGWRCAAAVPADARRFAGSERPLATENEKAWCQLGKARSFATLSVRVIDSRGLCIKKRWSSGIRASALSSVGSPPF
jgi:hypothetical protein